MEHIVAGRFDATDNAEAAAAEIGKYIYQNDVCIFYMSPPAQQEAATPKGDVRDDHGTQEAGASSAKVSMAAGLAAGVLGAVGGPLTAIAAAGVGAYTGSLVGALNGMNKNHEHPLAEQHRRYGVMVAVRIENPLNEDRVIATLEAMGAEDIEQAEGEWREGDWTDFDPLSIPSRAPRVSH